MPENDTTFEESAMEGFRKEKFDYRSLLMVHLNRISQAMIQIKSSPESEQTFYFAVIGLDTFLLPYHDKKFREHKNMARGFLYKNEDEDCKKATQKLMEEQGVLLPNWRFLEGSGGSEFVQYGMNLLGICQQLMARKGLLLEPETETEAKK